MSIFVEQVRYEYLLICWEEELAKLKQVIWDIIDYPEKFRSTALEEKTRSAIVVAEEKIAHYRNRIEVQALIGTTLIWRSADKRFYIGWAAFRPGICLQYLEDGGRREHCKIYVDTAEDARAIVDRIRSAEEAT